MLARRLATRHEHVVGIDRDEASIASAAAAGGVDVRLGDVMTYPFEPASFDAVVSVATLHHLDATAALTRMSTLLRPGGTLVVIGLARSTSALDLGWEISAMVAHRVLRRRARRRGQVVWELPSPTVWPPPLTYGEMRRLAARVLPGARFRRHLLWRYSLVWTAPRR